METSTFIAILFAVIGILLFAVGYLLGERKTRVRIGENAAPPREQPPVEVPAAIPSYPIPDAPKRQPPEINSRGYKMPMRIVSPREAVARAMRKADGLVDEDIPPVIAEQFLSEAAEINTRRQANGN